MTRVLLTGADGYIGIRMADHLMRHGHDVVGLDSGFHRVGWLYHSTDLRPTMITKDTRDVTVEDLDGFDALVHLAEVSNDPVGELSQDVTYHINHLGSLRLAELAKQAGDRAVRAHVVVQRVRRVGRPAEPRGRPDRTADGVRARARCSSSATCRSWPMTRSRPRSCATRRPTARRPVSGSTSSSTTSRHRRSSTARSECRATARRGGPFVHILDIAKAVECVLGAPRESIHDEIFNVGSDSSNYQVRQIAEIVGGLVPGCELRFGDSSADKRNYRADFTKIQTQLPGFGCAWDVERGAARAARRVRPHRVRRGALSISGAHPDRPDPPPARHASRSTTTSSGRTGRDRDGD